MTAMISDSPPGARGKGGPAIRSACDETAGERATRKELERLAHGQQAWRRDFAAAAITSPQACEELIPAQDDPVQRPAAAGAPQGIELRHLRYFVTLADAGSFTHAAELIFVAQPTLSQQIRRLEEILGTPLLQRRREGLKLTAAGRVLLDASRNVLALVDHAVSRTRQAAGWGGSGSGW
jgi:hypothetical protein